MDPLIDALSDPPGEISPNGDIAAPAARAAAEAEADAAAAEKSGEAKSGDAREYKDGEPSAVGVPGAEWEATKRSTAPK